ncbi:FeoA family protein [Thermincola ferriacetica]|uniref:FeoA family protein n=2 Tax=Thermincola TaxID=278993 RepID=D5XEW3_THEPJ|nr:MULTISPECIES: ferrous iron transport protein A [Thermincola]ADG82184.1 FeoA family protein [Thermincola potens JR]KNZ71202.1 FeoA family protein [Thermincola ferriacetica]
MNLDMCKKGQTIKIKFIKDALVRAQAIRFGIAEGEIVRCEEVIPAGPVVVSKKNQEIAIGRKLARNIDVELVS